MLTNLREITNTFLFLTSTIAGLTINNSALATPTSYTVKVELSDKIEGYLNCRASGSAQSAILDELYPGEVVFAFEDAETQDWIKVGRDRFYSGLNNGCWVSKDFVRYVDPFVLSGFLYQGQYRVSLTDPVNGYLNCRQGPAVSTPVARRLYHGDRVETFRVQFDDDNQSWLYTENGCFVMASRRFLEWDGSGEDPSTMCNPYGFGC